MAGRQTEATKFGKYFIPHLLYSPDAGEKMGNKVFFYPCSYPSNMLKAIHSVLDWVLQEVDTSQDQKSKTSIRVNAYGRERGGILGLGSQEEPSGCHAGMGIVKEREGG